jgi:hypothetical protein
MNLSTTVQLEIDRFISEYKRPQDSDFYYVNYVLVSWCNSSITGSYYENTITYSIGPYPLSIAQYIINYWLRTLSKHDIANFKGTYAERSTVSIKPRRGSTKIPGPTKKDLEALIPKCVIGAIPEHIAAYLDLQHYKDHL